LQHATFDVVVTDSKESGPYLKINEHLNYDQLIAITAAFLNNDQVTLEGDFQKRAFSLCGSDYTLIDETSARSCQFLKEIPDTSYYFTVWMQFVNGISFINEISFENGNLFNKRVEIIFPAFIPQFSTQAFKNRLNLFLQNELPVQITYGCHFIPPKLLEELIPVFASWHNTLVYDVNNELCDDGINYSDVVLAELMNEINVPAYD